MLLYTKFVKLNLFPPWTFGSDVDRARAKRFGQLSTRLYIFLLSVSIALLILYTVVEPQMLAKTFTKPPFDTYRRLVQDHGDTLQCPCSRISSPLENFVAIEPAFHQVRKESYANSCDGYQRNCTQIIIKTSCRPFLECSLRQAESRSRFSDLQNL